MELWSSANIFKCKKIAPISCLDQLNCTSTAFLASEFFLEFTFIVSPILHDDRPSLRVCPCWRRFSRSELDDAVCLSTWRGGEYGSMLGDGEFFCSLGFKVSEPERQKSKWRIWSAITFTTRSAVGNS